MDLVIIVLGILYLCGLNVGKALAICAIIEGVLIFTKTVLEQVSKRKEEDDYYRSILGEDDK